MAKASGGTRSSGPQTKAQPQTFEQQVDSALVSFKGEFFDRMENFYSDWAERWKEGFEKWKQDEDYIKAAGPSAAEQSRRANEVVKTYGSSKPALRIHDEVGRSLRDNYSDLVAGGYYKEGAKAPNFYDLAKGRNAVSEMDRAVKATAERDAEKRFANTRDKMLKSTIAKGLDAKNVHVSKIGRDELLISDGKVSLHARYIFAAGEVQAPHFRFIITDRKR